VAEIGAGNGCRAGTPGLPPRVASLRERRRHRPSSAVPGTALRISSCPRTCLLVRMALGSCTSTKITPAVANPSPRHSGATIVVVVTTPASSPKRSGCIILPNSAATWTSWRRGVAGARVRRHLLRRHLTAAAMDAIFVLGLCILNNLHALA